MEKQRCECGQDKVIGYDARRPYNGDKTVHLYLACILCGDKFKQVHRFTNDKELLKYTAWLIANNVPYRE